MNELTYTLAILVNKGVLQLDEAKKLLKSSKESVTNGDLKQMIAKVEKSLAIDTTNELESIDAKQLMGL